MALHALRNLLWIGVGVTAIAAAGAGAVGSCNGERATVRSDFTAGSRSSSVGQLALEGAGAGCALSFEGALLDGGTFRFIEDPDI